jgi:hypothetical protein
MAVGYSRCVQCWAYFGYRKNYSKFCHNNRCGENSYQRGNGEEYNQEIPVLYTLININKLLIDSKESFQKIRKQRNLVNCSILRLVLIAKNTCVINKLFDTGCLKICVVFLSLKKN